MKDIEELINKTINEEPEENIRLPSSIKPVYYRLKIFPKLDEFSEDNFTYTGEVKIVIRALQKTNRIILNVDEMDITDDNVTVSTVQTTVIREESIENESDGDRPEIYQKNSTQNNSTVIISDHENTNSTDDQDVIIGTETTNLIIQEVYREEDSFKLVIVLRNLLEINHNYTLNIKFTGNISNNLVGFYRTNYKDLSGNTR